MFTCICFGKTEKEIQDAINQGYDTVDKLAEYLNVTLGCGICRNSVKMIIDEHKKTLQH